jgi:hypothetical protein
VLPLNSYAVRRRGQQLRITNQVAKKLRRRILLVLGLLALLAAVPAAMWAYTLRQRLNAKSTQSWLPSLWVMCVSSDATDLAGVLAACREQGAACVPNDAWGNPFVVERLPSTSESPECRVISLGRDGNRGGCCQRNTGWLWDEDAVYSAGGWVQTWNYMASGKRQTRRP